MGLSWGPRLAASALAGLLAAGIMVGQSTVEESKRKVKAKVNPQFSELARKMNLRGKVKVEIVIAPDGHVKSSRAVGGHPVLVELCRDAVRDWKFEPAPEESTELLEFEFKPQQ